MFYFRSYFFFSHSLMELVQWMGGDVLFFFFFFAANDEGGAWEGGEGSLAVRLGELGGLSAKRRLWVDERKREGAW